MKKFFTEFKKFISRGNVIDLAVGVIIGGAFTSIVNALTNNILRPLINWVLFIITGGKGDKPVYTMLHEGPTLEESIYIDWGSFISAIINFILIALVLFIIIKTINKLQETAKKAEKLVDINKEKQIKQYRKQGLSKSEAKAKYEQDLKEQQELAKQKEIEEKEKQEKEKQQQEEKALANTKLLEEIRDLLKLNAINKH